MRVAVTGATGFVGHHLAAALRARGDEVVCLARQAARARELAGLGCSVVVGDLADPAALERLVAGAELVFHVAGLLAAPTEARLLEANRDGTARIAAAARRARAGRLVYVSSLAVTGPTRPGRPLDEAAPPSPVTPYGRSKRAGEEALREAGLPFTIVRPSVVYGPRDRELLRLFKLARLGVAPLLGNGRQELSLVHAADLADALVAAGTAEATRGGVYHAAHPKAVTQEELVRAIAAALGRRVRTVTVAAPLVRGALAVTGALARLQGRATLLSSDKADELLAPAWICSSEALARDAGWRARVDLARGLGETAAFYRAAGWLGTP